MVTIIIARPLVTFIKALFPFLLPRFEKFVTIYSMVSYLLNAKHFGRVIIASKGNLSLIFGTNMYKLKYIYTISCVTNLCFAGSKHSRCLPRLFNPFSAPDEFRLNQENF